MDNPRQLAAVILTCLLTVGCSTHQSKGQPSASDNSGVQKTDIQALRDQVNGLQKQLVLLRERVSRYDSISLDPTEKGYGRIDTSSGFFLILVGNAEPYLDGYRLHLRIGNPTSARYNGFKLTLTWQKPVPKQKDGESDQEFSKRWDEWLKAEPREKEFSFTEVLYPSSWNPVSLVVSPATPEELKELQISSMDTSQVALAERK